MNEYLIAFIGMFGIVLGGFLQFLYSRANEDKKRIREVREKRIDSVEELLNFMFTSSWVILEIYIASANDPPDIAKIEELMSESVSKISKTDTIDMRKLIACSNSLHDEIIDKLIDETVEFKNDIDKFAQSIPNPPDPYAGIKINKETMEKLILLRSKPIRLLSRIYDRLDYLRGK